MFAGGCRATRTYLARWQDVLTQDSCNGVALQNVLIQLREGAIAVDLQQRWRRRAQRRGGELCAR